MMDQKNPLQSRPGGIFAILQYFFYPLQVAVISAAVLATVFITWTPFQSANSNLPAPLPPTPTPQIVNTPAPGETPATVAQIAPENRIGIVAGHWGYLDDRGAVCADGLTELDVNLAVASLVAKKLTDAGYTVDMLKEFDDRLENYTALALVSIHADSCDYINDLATGFKVSAALGMQDAQIDRAAQLTACLRARYTQVTGLPQHNSITPDMTYYHAFDELNPNTTAAIIEVGFLNLDRQILTQGQDIIADGIVAGIRCFTQNETAAP